MALPSRHGLDFPRPQSQITIDSPDFHPWRPKKCLLGSNFTIAGWFYWHDRVNLHNIIMNIGES